MIQLDVQALVSGSNPTVPEKAGLKQTEILHPGFHEGKVYEAFG
jgi:hypothetical protein